MLIILNFNSILHSDEVDQIKFRRLTKKEISFEKYMEAVRMQCKQLDEKVCTLR